MTALFSWNFSRSNGGITLVLRLTYFRLLGNIIHMRVVLNPIEISHSFFRESSPQGSPKINYIDHIYFLYFNSWRNEVFIPGIKITFMCGAFIIILKTNSRKSLAICADLSALYPVVLATSAATVIKHRGHDYHFTKYSNPSSPRPALSVVVSYFILLIWRGQRWVSRKK